MFKQIIKKLIIATAIMTASGAALAAGPYVGASVGVNTDVFTVDTAYSTEQNGARGAIGSLFAGYGAMLGQSFYLGGEVFGDITNTTVTNEYTVGTTKLKERYGYGVSLIPGVTLSDHTMLFGRVGLVDSNFEAEAAAFGQTATKKKNILGAQFGLGVQTSLTQNVDLRGEYDFNAYRNTNFDGVKIKPRSDQFNLGVIYNFE